ncbi:MAG: hypothetical protein H2043_03100 [Rhizobiales bacterium]|nr:hypothetical protein [Hyphomicrobiales bacterium]
MDISARLKGSLAQAVVKAAFSHFEYRVVPFGIEETVREVASLSLKKYEELALPKTLRQTPDFIVASLDMSRAHLVEVKFRKEWSDQVRKNLFHILRNQVRSWGGKLIVVFVFRDFFGKGTCLKCLSLQVLEDGMRYLEVVSPSGAVKNFNDVTETDFCDLSAVFPKVETHAPDFKSALASIVSAQDVLSNDAEEEDPLVPEEVVPPVVTSPPQPRRRPPFVTRTPDRTNLPS